MSRIYDLLNEEEDYEKDKNYIAASNAGLKAWSYLKELMKSLETKSFCDLEYKTMYDLLYWASRLAGNLHNASIRDESFFQKKFLFCKEYVDMHENFLDENMRNLGGIRRALAECYIDTENFETCDNLYEKWLHKEPDWGWGWIGWSDHYWLFHGKNKPDLEKGLCILERGLAIKGVKDKNHMIDRLNDLKAKILAQSCEFSKV